jgi:hypothetical protein
MRHKQSVSLLLKPKSLLFTKSPGADFRCCCDILTLYIFYKDWNYSMDLVIKQQVPGAAR